MSLALLLLTPKLSGNRGGANDRNTESPHEEGNLHGHTTSEGTGRPG